MRPCPKPLSVLSIRAALGVCGTAAARAEDSAMQATARQAHEAYTTAINSNNRKSLLAMCQQR
jgi:hypothetical protein